MLAQSQLTFLVETKQAMPFKFSGSTWVLDYRAAVYWPEQDVLLVADLHFEKGSFLSQFASPVPRYDSRSTLGVLSSLIDTYQPGQMLCLGDSFHDIGAFERIIDEDVRFLQMLVKRVDEWHWLLGNHDPAIPDWFGGRASEQITLSTQLGEEIRFQHHCDEDQTAQVVGHYHPKAGFESPQRRFSGKCLVKTENKLIMPALGQYTGGLGVDDEVILALAPVAKRQCFLLYEQRVIPLPKGS